MTGWLAETLAASSFLMLVVLALRGPVARVFGAQAAYALWLLPALRMIMPTLPAEIVARSPVPTLQATVARAIAAAPPAETIDWGLAFACLWAGGAIAFIGLAVAAYRRFLERVGDNHVAAGKRDGIPVYVSPEVEGPVAVGFIWPAIVLPADHAARFAPAELELALRHEAAHHARLDPAANAVALLVRAAHWFNPIAAVAHRAFRADQEMACDARVLADRTAEERGLYAQALIKSAGGQLALPACALGGGGGLKRRVRMLSSATGREWRWGGVIASGAVIAAGLALTASGGVAAETATAAADQVRTVIRGDRIERRAPTIEDRITDAEDARLEAAEAAREAREDARDVIADARDPEGRCGRRSVFHSHNGRRVVLYCDAAAPVAPMPPVPPVASLASPAPPAPLAPIPPVLPVPSAREIRAMVAASVPSRVEIRRIVRDAQRTAAAARASIPSPEEIAEIRREAREAAREGRREALRGLREARADMEDAEGMNERDRAEALAAIDRAIANMERGVD